MILKKDKARHKLPERIETYSPRLSIYPDGDRQENPHSHEFCLIQVAPVEVDQAVKRTGQPAMFAVVHHPDFSALLLYPTPDRDYHATFRYHLPAKEI